VSCIQIELTFDGPAPDYFHAALHSGGVFDLEVLGSFRIVGVTSSDCNDEGRFQTVVLLRRVQGDQG
jgi:hypothetical protein